MKKTTLFITVSRLWRVSLGLILLTSLILVGAACEKSSEEEEEKITSFEECAAAGHPVLESYPRQCITPDGQVFVEDIGNELEKLDIIRINNPRPNQIVESPLVIEGEARGTWFFEGDFPVQLLDGEGNVIGTTIAQAQDEWMTEDFVPFKAELEFNAPTTDRGTLILKKDNPSGLPEHDDELRIPIIFAVE